MISGYCIGGPMHGRFVTQPDRGFVIRVTSGRPAANMLSEPADVITHVYAAHPRYDHAGASLEWWWLHV